jgi:hypothetical protein
MEGFLQLTIARLAAGPSLDMGNLIFVGGMLFKVIQKSQGIHFFRPT